MIAIRKTQEQDALILWSIQKEAFLPLYERYHDEGNPCLRGIEDIVKRLNTPYFRYFTILEDGEIVGGISYKCQGRIPFFDELKEGEYYLQRVYIKPERQCNKIAQTAILLCEKEFPDINVFYVDFPEDLVKNRRCYEGAGFKDTGKRMEAEPGLVLACFEKRKQYVVRRFQMGDAEEVSALITKTLRTTNIRDYSKDYIENDIKKLSPTHLIERAQWTHFYVVCDRNTIIGCGAIGPYWGKEDESSLFTIFVLPEYQGKGVGRKIIETLEQDEFFLRAKRIEIPASITACGFYKKMGYHYKDGIDSVDDEQLYRMEKFR